MTIFETWVRENLVEYVFNLRLMRHYNEVNEVSHRHAPI